MNARSRKKTWEQKVAIVKQSYQRCLSRSSFASHFYRNLFYLKPKIKSYFEKTDFQHQEKAILLGMNHLMGFLDESDSFSRQQVLRIAKTHSSMNMNIHPHEYYYWIEALIMTAKECDYQWYDELQYYWRECLSFPITFIISQFYMKHDT